MNVRKYTTVTKRRKALEKELTIRLSHTGSFTLDEGVASTRNCENMIGAAQVPLGIAGPLRINEREYYIPLATTEGALVASVNRGCKAITQSGGGTVVSQHIGTTRGSIFSVHSLREALLFKEWIDAHGSVLRRIAEKTLSHLTLLTVETDHVGTSVFVRWYFDTQDAMGMNMVTVAATALADYIQRKTHALCISVAGNFDVDKKPSWLNSIRGRGSKVWAEARISEKVLSTTLKTTACDMYTVWLNKCMLGSSLSGSMGFNAHVANTLAAMFIATGQDVAHVAECSLGITMMKPEDKICTRASIFLM